MLPDGKAVAKTTESLLNYGSKSIMVDMSSSHPDDTLALGKKLKENNIILMFYDKTLSRWQINRLF